MKTLFIASECTEFAKVGGLADVVNSLSKALKKEGEDVSVALPFYKLIVNRAVFFRDSEIIWKGKKESFKIYEGYIPKSKVPVYLINHPLLHTKSVYPKRDASSSGEDNEAEKFLFFSLASIELSKIINADILHAHDWHTAVIPYLVKDKKTVLTIHNLKYQGKYSKKVINEILGTNFKKNVNLLKLGIQNADTITTVSPTYVKEIQTAEFGFGLEKEIKKRKTKGILNGIDPDFFNPSTDRFIKQNYDIHTIENKEKNKEVLQKKYFTKKDVPVFGVVSRLADQKGFDLIMDIFDKIIGLDLQIIMLGEGDPKYETYFKKMNKYKNFHIEVSFNEKLAHMIYAGSDIFLMPSHFEPCGLGQMIALKYGCLPLVRSTGGLKDTVDHDKDGFVFDKYKSNALFKTIKHSTDKYSNKKDWDIMKKNAMKKDFSWNSSAKEYIKLYKSLLK